MSVFIPFIFLLFVNLLQCGSHLLFPSCPPPHGFAFDNAVLKFILSSQHLEAERKESMGNPPSMGLVK